VNKISRAPEEKFS